MGRIMAVVKKTFISLIVALIIGIFSYGWAYGQDPGIPDTIRFGEWATYLPCPPCTGRAVVPLVVYNDEYLAFMQIILISTGPVTWDSAELFTSERADHIQSFGFAHENQYAALQAISGMDSIPPGNGIFALLYLSVQDTGFASIDTSILPGVGEQTYFANPIPVMVIPEVIQGTEVYLSTQDIYPGDINGNGIVDIVDAVFLVNYLFRNGPEPAYLPCSDPNGDCNVTISDVVYLVNYVLKSGARPDLGCAF